MSNILAFEYEYFFGENNVARTKHEQFGRMFVFCVAVHIIEGEYFVRINDEVIKVFKGQTVMIPSGVKHDIWMEKEGILSYAHFSCDFSQIDILSLCKNKYIVFENPEVNKCLEKINNKKGNIIQNSLVVSESIAKLLNYAFESIDYDIYDIFREKQLVDVINYIDCNIDKDISVNDLIRISGLSKTSFYLKMREFVKIPPNEFILKKKIRYACELIINDYSVKESAFAVGFKDESYFSKVFKKITGLLPTEYKNSTASKWKT